MKKVEVKVKILEIKSQKSMKVSFDLDVKLWWNSGEPKQVYVNYAVQWTDLTSSSIMYRSQRFIKRPGLWSWFSKIWIQGSLYTMNGKYNKLHKIHVNRTVPENEEIQNKHDVSIHQVSLMHI